MAKKKGEKGISQGPQRCKPKGAKNSGILDVREKSRPEKIVWDTYQHKAEISVKSDIDPENKERCIIKGYLRPLKRRREKLDRQTRRGIGGLIPRKNREGNITPKQTGAIRLHRDDDISPSSICSETRGLARTRREKGNRTREKMKRINSGPRTVTSPYNGAIKSRKLGD